MPDFTSPNTDGNTDLFVQKGVKIHMKDARALKGIQFIVYFDYFHPNIISMAPFKFYLPPNEHRRGGRISL